MIHEVKGAGAGIYDPVAVHAGGRRAWIVNDSSVTRVDEATGHVLGIDLYGNHEFARPAAVMPAAQFVWEASSNGSAMIKLRLKR